MADEPAEPAPRGWVARRFDDWERTVAVAIGIVTLSAALLTYWAVLQDDASSQARGQATLETLQLQRQELISAVRVQGETAAADRYRRWLAEADALDGSAGSGQPASRSAQRRAEALVDRYVAWGYQLATFDVSRMTGTAASSTYDVGHRLETVQGYGAYENVLPGQPAQTAAVAEARHAESVRTLLGVVLLLLLVIVLTVGRILQPRWRPVVLSVAAAGWLLVGVGVLLNGIGS